LIVVVGGLAASKAALEGERPLQPTAKSSPPSPSRPFLPFLPPPQALSDALRVELLPLGVSVSVVRPGLIKTPALDKVKSQQAPDEARKVYSHLYTEEKVSSHDGDDHNDVA